MPEIYALAYMYSIHVIVIVHTYVQLKLYIVTLEMCMYVCVYMCIVHSDTSVCITDIQLYISSKCPIQLACEFLQLLQLPTDILYFTPKYAHTHNTIHPCIVCMYCTHNTTPMYCMYCTHNTTPMYCMYCTHNTTPMYCMYCTHNTTPMYCMHVLYTRHYTHVLYACTVHTTLHPCIVCMYCTHNTTPMYCMYCTHNTTPMYCMYCTHNTTPMYCMHVLYTQHYTHVLYVCTVHTTLHPCIVCMYCTHNSMHMVS